MTVRLPDELADDAETIARVRGESVNQLIINSLAAEIDGAAMPAHNRLHSQPACAREVRAIRARN